MNPGKYILKYRLVILVLWISLTIGSLFFIPKLHTEYGLVQLLTKNHESSIDFERFKTVFGEEEIVYVIGIDQNPLKDLSLFNDWNKLADNIYSISGVDTIISMGRGLSYFEKDTIQKKLVFKQFDTQSIQNDQQLEDYRKKAYNLPFYKGFLYSGDTSLMMVVLNRALFDSPEREKISKPIESYIQEFNATHNTQLHVSGMPYIRNKMRELVQKDFVQFILLSFVFCFGVILFIFRFGTPTLISFLIIITGILWSIGLLVLLNIKVTILTGIIPTLVIIIGVPNCIYIVNHFIKDFQEHKDKTTAILSTIKHIGKTTFLTNATTALGFFTFYFSGSDALQEFGLISAINIVMLYVLCITLIPVLFSYFAYNKHEKYERLMKNHSIEQVIQWVLYKQKWIVSFTIGLIIISIFGVLRVKTTGNITDELPSNHTVFKDIQWLEGVYGGIVPLNIYIESKNSKVYHEKFLKKEDALNQEISAHPWASKGICISDMVKFAKQGFYNNDSSRYQLINRSEQLFMASYIKLDQPNRPNLLVDSTQHITRINYLVKDLNAKEMDVFSLEIEEKLNKYFPKEKYRTFITGSSYVFLKGTGFLLENLFYSILLAIFIIGALMAFLFSSFRIILIAVVSNVIPLLLTLGFMGFIGVALKPSTILVYSIAFGISVDDTIHFLAKFKQLIHKDFSNTKEAVIQTLKSVGDSMMFTSMALFFGFIVFVSSQFQGTKAMGILLSFCLLAAMISNLIILPSLLLLLKKSKK